MAKEKTQLTIYLKNGPPSYAEILNAHLNSDKAYMYITRILDYKIIIHTLLMCRLGLRLKSKSYEKV